MYWSEISVDVDRCLLFLLYRITGWLVDTSGLVQMDVRSYIMEWEPFLEFMLWTFQQHLFFISQTQLLWIGLRSRSERHHFCLFCTHLVFCLTLGYPFNFDMSVSISEESERENRSQLPSYSLCPHQRTFRKGKGKLSSLQYVLARKDVTELTGKSFIGWNTVIYSTHFFRRNVFSIYQCFYPLRDFMGWDVTGSRNRGDLLNETVRTSQWTVDIFLCLYLRVEQKNLTEAAGK
jgi:hypothetical protein